MLYEHFLWFPLIGYPYIIPVIVFLETQWAQWEKSMPQTVQSSSMP